MRRCSRMRSRVCTSSKPQANSTVYAINERAHVCIVLSNPWIIFGFFEDIFRVSFVRRTHNNNTRMSWGLMCSVELQSIITNNNISNKTAIISIKCHYCNQNKYFIKITHKVPSSPNMSTIVQVETKHSIPQCRTANRGWRMKYLVHRGCVRPVSWSLSHYTIPNPTHTILNATRSLAQSLFVPRSRRRSFGFIAASSGNDCGSGNIELMNYTHVCIPVYNVHE